MAEIRTYQKGEIIFREGEPADCMYGVAGPAGAGVGIYKDYGTEDQVSLTVCPVNSYFGELALVNGSARTATAVAMDQVDLEVISAAEFDSMSAEDMDRMMDIIKNAATRLRHLTGQYLEAGVVLGKYFKSTQNGEKPEDEVLAQMQKYVK